MQCRTIRVTLAAGLLWVSGGFAVLPASADVTLSFVAVSVGFRTDNFDIGYSFTGGPITSLYQPGQVGLTERSRVFTFEPPAFVSNPSGTWNWGNASQTSSLFGSFDTTAVRLDEVSTMFYSPYGTMRV